MNKKFLLATLLFAATLPAADSLQAQTTGSELTAWISQAQAHTAAPLLSRSALKPGNAQHMSPMALAPDGSKVSYLIGDGPTQHLLLQDTSSGKTETLLTNDRLQLLEWTADSQALLLTMKGLIVLMPVNAHGQPRYLYKLDAKRKQLMVGTVASAASGAQPQLLIAASENRRAQLTLVDGDGNERTLYEGDGVINRAIADTGAHHLFVQVTTNTAIQILALEAQGPRVLLHCELHEVCELDAFDAASNKLWVRQTHDSDLFSLYSINTVTNQLTLEQQDPAHLSDLRQVCYANDQPQVMHYEDRGWRAVAVNKQDENALALLRQHFADSTFTVTGCSAKHWLLREESSRLQQYRYHLFDKASQRVTLLYSNNTVIDPAQLTDKHFLQYAASDGMLLNGYVSLPAGTPLAKAPLVALIHGGPNGRAVPDYQDFVQLLTNRGYIVFEPNFRGSVGFGRHYMRAANKDFGNGRVQQDMLDGLDWLLANGIGDRNQQAMVGGSFGGFAVLTALAYTPARFLAGMAMVPPADFVELIHLNAENPDARNPTLAAYLRQYILNVDDAAEVDALYRRSPMAALSAIQAPLLILAGGADPRVNIRHVRKYVSRLLMEHKPVSLLIDEKEGHGFMGEDATTVQLYLLEAFLATSLHGRVEPLQDERLKQYLQSKLLVNQIPGFEP